ncbi:MAG: tryptophan synthase subunit alpha [Planctomycetes bacterium]|nr:tryptophan synthase subunit alpha [Planctomycetota bacterium]
MSRIDTIFSDGKKKLMPFIVGGDPSLEVSKEVLLALDSAGADVIEIGIPFSDPIADGPVIAASMHRALQNGVTPSSILDIVFAIRQNISAGIIAMVSESIVSKSGGEAFIERLAKAGFDGIIIPDIDDAYARPLSQYCETIDFSFTMLVAPTTSLPRVQELAELSSGFLYILARTGLTGEQSEMPTLDSRLAAIREVTDLPLAVGFGISTAEHVAAVHTYADAAIVGSALVRRLQEVDTPAIAAAKFVQEITQ